MTKKTIKLVTVTIKKKRLYSERDKCVIFKADITSYLNIAKSQMYDFKKVLTWFPHWKGRKKCQAFKFKIPLWLYLNEEKKMNKFLNDIIIENTHKYSPYDTSSKMEKNKD